jgi:hypothetical protein
MEQPLAVSLASFLWAFKKINKKESGGHFVLRMATVYGIMVTIKQKRTVNS